jgi:hypothetical protein
MQAHRPLRPQDTAHFRHHHTEKVKREIIINETYYEHTAYIGSLFIYDSFLDICVI